MFLNIWIHTTEEISNLLKILPPDINLTTEGRELTYGQSLKYIRTDRRMVRTKILTAFLVLMVYLMKIEFFLFSMSLKFTRHQYKATQQPVAEICPLRVEGSR